jgi:hypothetical protein
MRLLPAEAMATEIENGPPLRIDAGIGPVRHPVGAHALTEPPHATQQQRYLGGRKLIVSANWEKVLAGALGRAELGATDSELLCAWYFLVHGARLGVGEVRHAVRPHALGVGEQRGVA